MVRRPRKRKKPSTKRFIGEALDHLVLVWRETMRGPRRRVVLAGFAFLFVVAMLLARQGTLRARVGGGAVLGGAVLALAALTWRERRIWADPRAIIQRLLGRVEPEGAARALRALDLLDDEGNAVDDGASVVLARLHVARQLGALPQDRIAAGADHLARNTNIATLVLVVLTLLVGGSHAWGVIEGADVLFARHGVAPVGMRWVDGMDLSARPPDYLHLEPTSYLPYHPLRLHRGTLITFRGTPAHAGRRIALSDGKSEVPFVDDGAGRVVARWPLQGSAELRVVARFGDVVIEDADHTLVNSIPDEAPVVTLEGAPKRIVLAENAGADIPIKYEAHDDHGLREVHLVLRCGTREVRRVLARLDGETRVDRGGSMLRATDSFLRRSHAPIEVRVEAKDNDPITGPKWGASPAITLIPPDVGESQALRMAALRALRDTYVDVLAWRIAHGVPPAAADRKKFLDEEKRGGDDASEQLDHTLADAYGGIHVPARLAALLRGQEHKLEGRLEAELRAPSGASHAALRKATETMVLVIDGILRGTALRDAREAGRQLADVADDLALGFSQIQRGGDETARGMQRVDAAVLVLQGGSKQLHQLGSLGRDLGGAITAALLRVQRGRAAADFPHAELASRDLAARLHKPEASFGAKGGRGRAGGESGGGRGTPMQGDDGESSEAERAFNEAAQDLEQLTQDHAGQMGKVEQALSQASSAEDVQHFRDEAKSHAKAVREATAGMPTVGAGSDSWTSKGAAAREHAEQMARSLEQGNAANAVQSGRDALQALDEAKRIAARQRWESFDETDDGSQKRLDDAKRKLEPEVAWAEQQLAQMRKRASERAAGDLQKDGQGEAELAERTHKLADKARDKGSLPEPAVDALESAEEAQREAAQALQRGDADEGLARQRDAQHKLELAKQALGQDEGQQSGQDDADDGHDTAGGHADIPNPDQHKGPEDFRRRVIDGLGRASSAKQKDAIKRYAEGLLR